MSNEMPSPDGWDVARERILPSAPSHTTFNTNGTTNGYGAVRTRNDGSTYLHEGEDINHIGGSAANQNHPPVHTPIAGTVTEVGGNYGAVVIRDAEGYSHRFLHLNSQDVIKDQQIEADTRLGGMGGQGPNGPNHYSQHVHYEIRDPNGQLVDPKQFHRERAQSQSQESQADTQPQPQSQPQSSGNLDTKNLNNVQANLDVEARDTWADSNYSTKLGARVTDDKKMETSSPPPPTTSLNESQTAPDNTAENQRLANIFRDKTLSADEVAKDNPRLAPSFAALKAVEEQTKEHGLSEERQNIVMDRARENFASQIESGKIPSVQIREQQQIMPEAGQSFDAGRSC